MQRGFFSLRKNFYRNMKLKYKYLNLLII